MIGGYLVFRDIIHPKKSVEYGLKIPDYVGLFIALFVGLCLLIPGTSCILITIATIFNLDNLRESFSMSDFVFIIPGICSFIFGIYIIKCLIKIFLCNCKLIVVDINAQQLVLKLKNHSLIELPFGAISEINIKRQGIIRGISLDIVKIYTVSGEIYTLTTASASDLSNMLPDSVRKIIND